MKDLFVHKQGTIQDHTRKEKDREASIAFEDITTVSDFWKVGFFQSLTACMSFSDTNSGNSYTCLFCRLGLELTC